MRVSRARISGSMLSRLGARDREETGLRAVGGSRQGYAKPLRIQRAFAGLAMRLDGSVRDRSLCVRYDRSPCRFDLFAQLQNLAAGGLDQCPRLGHEVAMLGVHRACSRGFERPNELQRMNGYFGSLVAAKTTPLSSSPRGAPRDARVAGTPLQGPRSLAWIPLSRE